MRPALPRAAPPALRPEHDAPRSDSAAVDLDPAAPAPASGGPWPPCRSRAPPPPPTPPRPRRRGCFCRSRPTTAAARPARPTGGTRTKPSARRCRRSTTRPARRTSATRWRSRSRLRWGAGRAPWATRPARARGTDGRRRAARSRAWQDLRAGLGDGDGVLPVAGELAVAGHHGPAVGERVDLVGAEVDHRLDGQDHPRPHARIRLPPGPERRPIVGHLRILVELLPDAVADVVADDAVAEGRDVRLDRGADVADAVARLHRRDPLLQRLPGFVQQARRLRGHL